MFLDQIMNARRANPRIVAGEAQLAQLKRRAEALPTPRDLAGALRAAATGSNLALIAEIKKASPSRGVLAPGLRVDDQARLYEEAGAAAISVVTEESFFLGSLGALSEARHAASLPILRKDFLTEEWEIWETRAHGADACLLIAALLEGNRLAALAKLARRLGMTPLIEVHDAEELERALETSPALIGINNRSLRTFAVDLEVTRTLAPRVPRDVLVVSESGLATAQDVQTVRRAGARAILVGESLVTDPDPRARIARLLATGGPGRRTGTPSPPQPAASPTQAVS